MNQNLVINALKAVWNAYQTKHEKSAAEYEKDIVTRFNTLMHIEFRMFRLHRFNENKYGKHCEGDQDRQNYSARQRAMMHPPQPSTKCLPPHEYDQYKAAWEPTQLLVTDDAARTLALRLPLWHLPQPMPP